MVGRKEWKREMAHLKRSCSTKKRFESEIDAKRFANKWKRMYGKTQYPYYCEAWCGGWHLTSKPPKSGKC